MPNVTVLTIVPYVDEERVVLACQFFNKTSANLDANPWAQVSDPDQPPAPVVPDHDMFFARASALRRRDRRPAADTGAIAMGTLLAHRRARTRGLERRWWTLIAVCGSTFMLLVDIFIVQVALPTIHRRLGGSFTDLQSVIDASPWRWPPSS